MQSAVLLLSLIGVFQNCGCSKLNMPKVLLPLARSTRINFTLETTEGCYRWTSTRPEVASVQPIDEETGQGCSRKAVLQALSTQPSRLTSIILAEDVVTGQILRCDAIVDVIYDVTIVSTTRELHLEDSPLALEIHALDSEGNTFSTLAGLVFDWSIVKDVDVNGFSDSYDSLRFLKFSDSTYTPPEYISEMEHVGKQGNIILVSGLKTGHAKVKARIQESLYQGVDAAEVKLLILENILLSPAHNVYLMVGTSIRYQVLKIRQGSITELSMPCDQYELHLENSVVDTNGNPDVDVARLDQRTSTVAAIQLGHINVVLDHKSLRMQGVFRLPNSTLFVVEPAYLGFKIHPGNSWVLEMGRDYDIQIEVLDKSGNKLYLSDALDPVSVAVVTLGSSKDMLFEGGPQPWVLEPSKFFCELRAEEEESVSLTLISPLSHNYDQHLVRATCKALGEQMLEVRVRNKASVTNPYPAVERASVKFVCAPPSRLTLVPVYAIPQQELACPLLQQNKYVVPVSNYRNSVLDLAAFDHQGRKFDNFSSLSIVWESSKVSLASIEPILPMTLHPFKDENKQMKLHGRQTIVVHRQSGPAAITATALDYQLSHIKAAKIQSRVDTFTPVSATLELILVEDVHIFPDTLTLYNHPDVRGNLALREGSGHFVVKTSVKDVADVVLQDTQGTAQVSPIQPGVVQVMVHDLCLASPLTAKATVHVSEILEVNLRVVDKVEIGKSVRCYVRLLDDNKKPFPASYFHFMKLKVKAASSIVSLKPVAESTEHDTAVYLVKGVSIGQTTLSAVVVDRNERKLSSAPQQIEVFPPFKLIPRKMTLLIGAMMQITSEGGPQPQSNILFSLTNEDIASVNGIGHVKGMTTGNVTVTGLIQAVDAETGKLVVVSKDQVEVEVVRLTAIRIRAPITRIKTGAQMPVYVMGLTNSQTPFTFANALPGLSFHWSTTKRDILDVQSRHSVANVALNSEYNFGMSVTGRTRGRTGLKVVLRVVDPVLGQLADNLPELEDEVQIQVYDKLHMFNPKVEAEEILMTPNSVLKLQTNRDGVGALSYRMLDHADQVAIAQVDEKGFLVSGSITGISPLLVTSQESFGVNQTLIIAVKVVPVSYMRFSTSPALHTYTKESLKALPLGIVLTFTVYFHASTGEVLHSSNSHLTFSTNRDDLVQVGFGPSNHTLTVRTVNTGLTLLSVHDSENTVVADYIPLPVEHAIQPEEAQRLVVGDVICFTAQLASQDGGHGIWSSSANAILQVDSTTGAAVARDSGAATVYYEIPGVLKTYREVVVESATKTAAIIAQQALPVKIGKQTEVFLTTRGQGTNLIGTCSSFQTEAIAQLQPETSVACHLSFTNDAVDFPASSIFKTHTSFDTSSGFYTCSVTLQPTADQLTRVASMTLSNLLVKAALEGSAFSGEQVSARLPIEPGMYSDRTELTLSNLRPTAELTVFGAADAQADMEAVSSSPIIGIQKAEAQCDFPSLSKYTVRALDLRAAASASIIISSASSGQSLVIPVTLIHVAEPGANTQAAAAAFINTEGGLPLHGFKNSYHMMLFTLFALLASTAIVVIVLHTVFSPKQQAYPPSVILRTPPPVAAPDSFNHPTPRQDANSNFRLRLYSTNY
ncbi:nuclear pore membrane glycoprotein 210 isoform X5 [Hippocampus comes]|uniref:nuclear pore membrane glycoprotein 210 isoform X5 n=1 Tax=Hippocampus comes TaxID=109280 RepID=UPI00094E2276|nr:PREDICTED: nuclear pore membrane glycoprotein 210 isoform X5 [Hippocampus comes]